MTGCARAETSQSQSLPLNRGRFEKNIKLLLPVIPVLSLGFEGLFGGLVLNYFLELIEG